MFYQVLSPVVATIEGDTLKEAIKNFTKINYLYQYNNLVIANANKQYNANIDYYRQDNKKKIGIKITNSVGLDTYPRNTFIPLLNQTDNGIIQNTGTGFPIFQPNIINQPTEKTDQTDQTDQTDDKSKNVSFVMPMAMPMAIPAPLPFYPY